MLGHQSTNLYIFLISLIGFCNCAEENNYSISSNDQVRHEEKPTCVNTPILLLENDCIYDEKIDENTLWQGLECCFDPFFLSDFQEIGLDAPIPIETTPFDTISEPKKMNGEEIEYYPNPFDKQGNPTIEWHCCPRCGHNLFQFCLKYQEREHAPRFCRLRVPGNGEEYIEIIGDWVKEDSMLSCYGCNRIYFYKKKQ
ncbi:hypothetical protein M153_485000642 [Pseudoloma neurophilia]|uniref:Uncharacterized protein n=1 Tax=Pseudoloma neurophilia TaxID=146866 RepID=A0A0R0M4E9_9MICR|nr:hypothetical protein M153_485000642 [Pseudoloma neurophilia]